MSRAEDPNMNLPEDRPSVDIQATVAAAKAIASADAARAEGKTTGKKKKLSKDDKANDLRAAIKMVSARHPPIPGIFLCF